LQSQADEAEAEAERTGETASKAQQRCAEAGRQLASYRDTMSSYGGQRQFLAQIEKQVEEHRAAVRRAELEQESALRTRQAARAVHDKLLRAHAAAHAATGLVPGDPCPICSQVIAKGFVPPRAPGIESARKTLDEAEGAVAEAQRAVTKSQTDLAHSEKTRESAAVDLATLAEKLADITARVRELLPGADLLASDEDVLKPAVGEERKRLAELEEKQKLAKQLRSAADRADADFAARRRALLTQRASLARAQASLEKDKQRCETDRQSLPVRGQPGAADGNPRLTTSHRLTGPGRTG